MNVRQREVIVGFLLAAFALTTTVTAQAPPPWTIASAAPAVLQSGVGLRTFPAPDGQQLAYERKVRLNGHQDLYLCAANVVSGAEPTCLTPPQDMPRGFDADASAYHLPLSWSPDSARLAVVGQPLVTGQDTDLWIMDVAASTWTNLTDDGYEGPLSGAPSGVTVEVQPVWSPDGTRIAVERTLINEAGQFAPSTLSVIDLSTGDITEIGPLPGHAEQVRDAGAITSLAWSPDGAALAISVRHREPDPASDGVWLARVEGGTMTPLVDAATVGALFAGVFPDLTAELIGPVAWSPDGAALLFWASNASAKPVAVWAFWVDVESGVTTTLALPAHTRDTGSRRGIWPFQAAWSPDGGALLVAANGLGDEEKIPLDPASSRVRMSVYLADAATGAATLLGHLPTVEATPFYFAAWSEAGDALLNGYHLVMEQG